MPDKKVPPMPQNRRQRLLSVFSVAEIKHVDRALLNVFLKNAEFIMSPEEIDVMFRKLPHNNCGEVAITDLIEYMDQMDKKKKKKALERKKKQEQLARERRRRERERAEAERESPQPGAPTPGERPRAGSSGTVEAGKKKKRKKEPRPKKRHSTPERDRRRGSNDTDGTRSRSVTPEADRERRSRHSKSGPSEKTDRKSKRRKRKERRGSRREERDSEKQGSVTLERKERGGSDRKERERKDRAYERSPDQSPVDDKINLPIDDTVALMASSADAFKNYNSPLAPKPPSRSFRESLLSPTHSTSLPSLDIEGGLKEVMRSLEKSGNPNSALHIQTLQYIGKELKSHNQTKEAAKRLKRENAQLSDRLKQLEGQCNAYADTIERLEDKVERLQEQRFSDFSNLTAQFQDELRQTRRQAEKWRRRHADEQVKVTRLLLKFQRAKKIKKKRDSAPVTSIAYDLNRVYEDALQKSSQFPAVPAHRMSVPNLHTLPNLAMGGALSDDRARTRSFGSKDNPSALKQWRSMPAGRLGIDSHTNPVRNPNFANLADPYNSQPLIRDSGKPYYQNQLNDSRLPIPEEKPSLKDNHSDPPPIRDSDEAEESDLKIKQPPKIEEAIFSKTYQGDKVNSWA